MKRVISAIISLMIMSNMFVSFTASAETVDVNLPAYDCELGFIFETDGSDYCNTNPDDYPGINLVFDELNMYYASSLDTLKGISDKFNIVSWEENYEIEMPDSPEVDIEEVINNSVSLFSTDETDNEPAEISDQSCVNDPWFEWQWYYDAVHAQVYRDNGIDGTGVTVAVIDSGFNNDLDDFNYDNISVINVPAIIDEDEDQKNNTDDTRNHGVPITSIIAAQTNNGIGIAGMTDNVRVLSYKTIGTNGTVYAESVATLKAFVMAYEAGVDVISLSQGEYTYSSSKENLINYLTDKGIIFVASVGNDGNKASAGEMYNAYAYPASYENVIAVGAVAPTYEQEKIYYNTETYQRDEKDNIPAEYRDIGWIWYPSKHSNNEYKKCVFSTANDSIFVSAPGTGMHMYGINNEKINKAGTSFASPIVASAAIGVKQMRPYVDTDMFKEILKATSVDLDEEGYDINTGWGMVDFQAIYDYVSQMPETIPEKTPEITIDFANKKLCGFEYGSKYLINDEILETEKEAVNVNYDTMKAELKDYTIDIRDEWYGTTLSIKKLATKDGFTDSEIQDLYIPSNKENTPNIEIDFADSVLKGFSDEKVYQINGEEITPLNGEYAIPDAWFGTTISIQIKAAEQYYIDSEVQELMIPQKPDAPNIKYNIIFDDDGSVSSIDGITEEMEFRKVGLDEWTTGEITSAGEYEIRYKATKTSFPSITYVITFEDKEPEVPTVHEYDVETSVSYENGKIGYSYTNYTEQDVPAIGIIAVYDTNNHFIGLYTIDGFKTGTNSGSFNVEGNVGSVKFFAWEDLIDMMPYDKMQISECILR